MSVTVRVLLVITAVVVALFVLDRVALWAESRGWIYYRKTKRSTGANLGDAFLEVHSMLEPGQKHVLEIRREEKRDETEEGDPPLPGAGRRTTTEDRSGEGELP